MVLFSSLRLLFLVQVFEDDGVTDDEDEESLDEDKAEQRQKRPKRTKQNTIKYESDEEVGDGGGTTGPREGAKPENVQNEEALSCRNSRRSSVTSDTNVGRWQMIK